MKVGLIGAGRQGKRRADALRQSGDKIAIVADAGEPAAKALGQSLGCAASTRWEDVVENREVEAVLVCTPPDTHFPMCIAAMESGKHVLCEKPLARDAREALQIVQAAEKANRKLKCGFNLRMHPGMQQVRKWLDQGAIGEPNFIRCKYGIMGIPDITRDWRGDPMVAGGGEVMDRGIHLADLCRWYMGDFSEVVAFVTSRYWKLENVEDNGFALLKTRRGQVASMHVSSTQWRNIFSLELYGEAGYAVVEGLGYVYGNERAILAKKPSVPGPNHEEVIEYLGPDQSWLDEWKEFTGSIKEDRMPLGNGRDGLEALKLVNAVYESSRTGCAVKL